MTGEDNSFDKAFYNELVSCIEKYDRELVDVVNAQWQGFKSYAKTGGNPGVDDWIRCDQYGVRIFSKLLLIFQEKNEAINTNINISTAFSRAQLYSTRVRRYSNMGTV